MRRPAIVCACGIAPADPPSPICAYSQRAAVPDMRSLSAPPESRRDELEEDNRCVSSFAQQPLAPGTAPPPTAGSLIVGTMDPCAPQCVTLPMRRSTATVDYAPYERLVRSATRAVAERLGADHTQYCMTQTFVVMVHEETSMADKKKTIELSALLGRLTDAGDVGTDHASFRGIAVSRSADSLHLGTDGGIVEIPLKEIEEVSEIGGHPNAVVVTVKDPSMVRAIRVGPIDTGGTIPSGPIEPGTRSTRNIDGWNVLVVDDNPPAKFI